jgi:preprotein translocase subunit SecB
MIESNKSAFQFDNFKIIRSIFDRKDGEISKKINIGFLPSAKYFKAKGKFVLLLNVKIFDANKLLNIEVIAEAEYTLKGTAEGKLISNYFYINAPAILFPYIRAYISTLTTLSGYSSPITLPTMNLASLAKDLEKNTEII